VQGGIVLVGLALEVQVDNAVVEVVQMYGGDCDLGWEYDEGYKFQNKDNDMSSD
jgi:hypothetical protein